MSIGFKEILIVLIIAFLLFGGRRLPELGRGLGKGITNFRKALSDIEHSDEKSENHKVENEPKAWLVFGLSWTEMGVVAVVALLVLGPEKLPGAMRGLGRIYGQFSRLMAEFHRAMDPKDPHFLGNLEYKPKNKVLENLKTTESSTNAPAEPPSTPVPLDTEIEKLESEEPEKIGS